MKKDQRRRQQTQRHMEMKPVGNAPEEREARNSLAQGIDQENAYAADAGDSKPVSDALFRFDAQAIPENPTNSEHTDNHQQEHGKCIDFKGRTALGLSLRRQRGGYARRSRMRCHELKLRLFGDIASRRLDGAALRTVRRVQARLRALIIAHPTQQSSGTQVLL